MKLMTVKNAFNPKILLILDDFKFGRLQKVYDALKDLEKNEPQFQNIVNDQYGKRKEKKVLLNLAVLSEDIKIIELLLRNKADPTQCDTRGMSALCLARKLGNIKSIELLKNSSAVNEEKKNPEAQTSPKRKDEAVTSISIYRYQASNLPLKKRKIEVTAISPSSDISEGVSNRFK